MGGSDLLRASNFSLFVTIQNAVPPLSKNCFLKYNLQKNSVPTGNRERVKGLWQILRSRQLRLHFWNY